MTVSQPLNDGAGSRLGGGGRSRTLEFDMALAAPAKHSQHNS